MNITQPTPDYPVYVVSDILSSDKVDFLRKVLTGLKDPVFNKDRTEAILSELQDSVQGAIKSSFPELGNPSFSKDRDVMINEEGFEMAVQWNGVIRDSGVSMMNVMTMFFVNDNYAGGEYYFPSIDYTYKPKAGDLVLHPGGDPFGNGIQKVSGPTPQVIVTLMGFKG